MPEAARRIETPPSPAARGGDRCSAPPPGYILASDAGTVLGCSARTVKRRVAAGDLAGGDYLGAGGRATWVDPSSDPRLRAVYCPQRPGMAIPGLSSDDGATAPSSDAWQRLNAAERDRAAGRLALIRDWAEFHARVAGDVRTAFDLWRRRYPNPAARGGGIPGPEGPGLDSPSYGTICRWQRALRDAGGDIAAIASDAWGGNTQAAEPDPLLWRMMSALWLNPNRPTLRDCWLQVGGEAARLNRPWLGYAACARRIAREIPTAVRVLKREGVKRFEDTCVPFVERDYASIAPMDWWVADHKQFDVAVKHPDNGMPVFPWLTCWFDVKSRKPVGRVVCLQPNSDTIMLALRRGILDYGVPRNGYVDNGKDFRSRQFSGGRPKRVKPDWPEEQARAMLALLRAADPETGALEPVGLHFAQPFNAKAKPVERWFRTAGMQFERLWRTYRGNRIGHKPEGLGKLLADYERLAVLPTIDEFEAAFESWVADDYCKAAHRGRGMGGRSPDAVFFAERRAVTRVDESDLAMLAMRHSEPRVVGRNGISLFDRSYHAPELMHRLGERIYVRYDARAIGRLYCFTLDDRFICTAARKDLVAWGASREDLAAHQKAKARYRRTVREQAETGVVVRGGVEGVARRRAGRAALAPGEHTGGNDPTPPGEAAPPIEPERIRIFRSAYASAQETIRKRAAVGSDETAAAAALAPGEHTGGSPAVYSRRAKGTMQLGAGGDVVDRATGEVILDVAELPDAGTRGRGDAGLGEPTADELMDGLDL